MNPSNFNPGAMLLDHYCAAAGEALQHSSRLQTLNSTSSSSIPEMGAVSVQSTSPAEIEEVFRFEADNDVTINPLIKRIGPTIILQAQHVTDHVITKGSSPEASYSMAVDFCTQPTQSLPTHPEGIQHHDVKVCIEHTLLVAALE
jgi:hypothetical protein